MARVEPQVDVERVEIVERKEFEIKHEKISRYVGHVVGDEVKLKRVV